MHFLKVHDIDSAKWRLQEVTSGKLSLSVEDIQSVLGSYPTGCWKISAHFDHFQSWCRLSRAYLTYQPIKTFNLKAGP